MDGLVIKHPTTGAVIFNAATITGHSRAAFNTSASAGSLSVAGLLRGEPFIIQALPTEDSINYNVPDFQISGSTISWNAAARSMRVLAGSRAVGGAGASQSFDGFMVRRPGGAMQISTADFALQLVTYGAATLTDDGLTHPQPMVQASITVSGVNPVLAFRGQDGARINVRRIVASGGNWTFQFTCQSGSAVGLIYWVFDVTGQALKLNTDVGLMLKDSTGVKTFDSRCWTLNILADGVVASAPGQTTVRQASGRTYAAIQSTISYRSVMADEGAYSSAVNPPSTVERGEVLNPRPANTRWAYMRGQTFHSTAQAQAGGGMVVGSTLFENYEGWYANSIQPSDQTFGTTRHCVIDVTGLPSAAMPSPTSLSVSVSSNLREVTVSSSGPTSSVTPAVTASASGGTAPYTYLWSRREGGGGVGAYGPTDQASFQTQAANQPPGSTYQETWGCRVTDAAGRVGYSPDVVFRHIVTAIDLTPDAITFGDASTSTNDATGYAGVPSRQITGISQPITLRAERFNYSGDLSTCRLRVYKGPSATGPWTELANLDARGTATRYIDFTMSNGEWFYFYAEATTTSRRKSGAFDVTIWNESTGHSFFVGSHLALIVDADDNFNVIDQDLDPIDWGNIFFDSGASSYYTTNAYRTMAGINANVSLSVQISDFYVTGAIQNSQWAMQSATRGDLILANLGDGTRTATVQPNEQIRFGINIATTGGRREFGMSVSVYNASTGAFIDHFSMSGYVGS